MSYEWAIATRYLSAARRRGFVSFVAFMSVMGLMLGVAVLIVVLSVMNGFERELRSRILSVTPHATLSAVDGPMQDWRKAQQTAAALPGVLAAVPYVESQAMVAQHQRVLGVSVRGIDPRATLANDGLVRRMQRGSLADLTTGGFRIVLGEALANDLGAHLGDRIIVMAPQATATPGGVMPRMRHFEVSGIFASGMYEFDRGLALVNLQDAARLYQLGDAMSGVRLTLKDPYQAAGVVRQLALALGGGFYVSDWTRNHASFFRSIELTKSMMFVILLLLVGVAAFNIVATLVMIVKEKQQDIAILRTLGAGPRNVLVTFALQGIFIGLAGTLLGALLGVLLAHNLEMLVHALERVVGTTFMDAKVYLMSDLPAYVEWRDVLQVCGVAFVLCALATLYPAWRASRTLPAQALRNE